MATNYFQQRLTEVAAYFRNGDHHLGYRRLMDAAIETRSFNAYEQTLAFCNWYDDHQQDRTAVEQQVSELLNHLDKAYQEPAGLPTDKVIEARQIAKRYGHGNFQLSALDITLHPAEIIGLVGENGNGKTTLLRLLYGELEPDSGQLHYHFRKGTGRSDQYHTKCRIAFIPQRPDAWYGSLMENLQLASVYAGYEGKGNVLWTEMMIARMGLRPFRTYTWSRISSGYKMRFELARTLLRRPEVLLLDEPLANLDMLAQQVILEDLRYLAQSHTMPLSIILSSQQLYEVEKVSDQVIFLQNGVAKYQHAQQTEDQPAAPLVIELETTASRHELEQQFSPLALQKISFNGGVYLLYFDEGTDIPAVLSILAEHQTPVKYFRDISTSSRRFFDA